jgi:Ca2+-binding RTX toxin-like protein
MRKVHVAALGNTLIDGRGGDDAIFGDAGADRIDGGAGADHAEGGGGGDRCVTDAADDPPADCARG